MKQILILIFVLSLIGCEFMKERYVPPASESEIDSAWSDVDKYGNVNRNLTICDNRILTTPERCLNFEMTRVDHLTPSLSGRA